ncbi:STAS/SEC14 domain-containing protein [candidate division WOR-3 bacterium]|nr:STAS/SEC14 domain-containing protein [candidate division WOR-3 bacterium]
MKEIITFEPPETIVMTLRGKLEAEETAHMFEKWATFVDPSKKIKVLVDLSKLEEIPPQAREALKVGGRKFLMSKVSSFGASIKMRVMAGLVLKMVPQVDKSAFFKTEAEARAWLEDKK